MKTKIKTKKNLQIIRKLREIRDKINQDIKDMSPDELREYIKKQKTLRINKSIT